MKNLDDLANWSLHCFCLGARKTPHALVRSEQNGRLLFKAKEWTSLVSLERAGISISEASLTEMVQQNVLERQDDLVRSKVPRFGPDEICPQRDQMAVATSDFLSNAQQDIEALAQELAANGSSHSFYAVFFGRVMDGLLWAQLRHLIDIPETRLTVGFPDWRGVFWAVYPPVEDAIGTNEISCGGATLTLVWSENTKDMLNNLRQQHWPRTFLGFLNGDIAEPPQQALNNGLMDNNLNILVPVFGNQAFSGVSHLAEHLAKRAAERFVDLLSGLSFAKDLSPSDRNVILAHEYIWAMQTAFRKINSPLLGQIAETCPPTDLRGSVFVNIHPSAG